jgi:hypothetical protein
VLVVDHILFLGLPIVQRLVRDGHEVVYATVWGPDSDSPIADFLGAGLKGVTLAPEGWMRWIDWADVATITGSEHRGHVVKFLRDHGVPVAGPGPWATQLELDRGFGNTVAKEAGILVPWQKEFHSADDLADYVEAHPQPYVLKLDQTLRDASETIVSTDPQGNDIVDIARRMAVTVPFGRERKGFYLQEVLEGTEVAVGGWFNGEEIVGDLYVSYDANGGFVYDLRIPGDRFIDRKKLTARLKEAKHRGMFDINGMLVGDKFYYLEWTPRWGCGMTEFFCHCTEDLGKLLLGVATGKSGIPVHERYMGKVATIVNVRMEDGDLTVPLEITLPPGRELPLIDELVSFFPTWPARMAGGRWLNLAVQPKPPRRGGYVGIGDTLPDAVKLVEDLADEAHINQAIVDSPRILKELQKRVDTIYRYVLGEGWISDLARSTRHNWTSPLRPPVRP